MRTGHPALVAPSDGTVAVSFIYIAEPMPPKVFRVITFARNLVINVTELLNPITMA